MRYEMIFGECTKKYEAAGANKPSELPCRFVSFATARAPTSVLRIKLRNERKVR